MTKTYEPQSFLGRGLLIAAALALAAFAASDRSKYQLGTDLAGGTILEYAVKQDPDNPKQFSMDELTSALKRRLDPEGLKSYRINGRGGAAVEIVMPMADQAAKAELMRRISTVGQLRFRIVADAGRHKDEIELAVRQWPKKIVQYKDENQQRIAAEFVRYGVWRPADEAGERGAAELLAKNRPDDYRHMDVALVEGFDPKAEADGQYLVKTAAAGKKTVFSRFDNEGNSGFAVSKVDDDGLHYVLLYNDAENVVGDDLIDAGRSFDDTGEVVSFRFNLKGAGKFGRLTTEYQPDRATGRKFRLAVVYENRVRSAPSLNSPIRDRGQITGFKGREIDELVGVLNAGKLPVGLEKTPSRDVTMTATLGDDTIKSGKVAVMLSLAVIGAFMLWYYRLAGLVSIVALALNLLFTLAVMVMLQQTWTLPGIAGLVLTVGMSVDANVLVYERIREELARGAATGTAIKLGYERAWLPILDSMVTSVLTASVLYFIGTDTVRGFAVTLVCGLATGLFSGLYCTRFAFEWMLHRGILKGFRFRQFLTNPNYNFLGFTRKAVAASLVLIAAGAAAFAYRGGANFDIDFTGGTLATMHFNKPVEPEKVRGLASAAGVKDVAIERLAVPGAPPNLDFTVRTTDKDEAATRERLGKAFKEYLGVAKVGIAGLAKIPEKSDDPFLRGFAGGESGKLTVERPRTEESLRGLLDDVLKADNPNLTDSKALVALAPDGEAVPLPGVSTTAKGYTTFRVAAARGVVQGLLDQVNARLAAAPEFEQFSSFGPQAASDMKTRAVAAIALSWLLVILWVGYRFASWSFGLGGVVALIHDVFVSTGLLALVSVVAVAVPALEFLLLGEMKINLDSIAALLTLIGYSIHDTIVTFDRIRELRGRGTEVTPEMANRAINETLGRTIITSALTFSSVLILFIAGGAALRGFSFLLVVGLLSGTYSTIFIASPFMLWFMSFLSRRKAAAAPLAGPLDVAEA